MNSNKRIAGVGSVAMYKVIKLIAFFAGALACGLLLDFTMVKLNGSGFVAPLFYSTGILVVATSAKLFRLSMEAMSLLDYHSGWMWVDNVTSVSIVMLWLATFYISAAFVNGGFGGIL